MDVVAEFQPIYTPDQIRVGEQPLLAELGEALMLRAAHQVALQAVDLLRSSRGGIYGARVGVLAGAGGNGGDALYAASELARRGVQVSVVCTSERVHAPALAALRAASGAVRILDHMPAGMDLIIDGVVGIGASGGLRGRAGEVVAEVAALAPRPLMLSVDIPSGVDPLTGVRHEPAVHPDRTITFGGLKPAHVLGREHCGTVVLTPVGIDAFLPPSHVKVATDALLRRWPQPGPGDHKYSLGTVELHTGSPTYPGAGLLSAAGAVAATPGMVSFAADSGSGRLGETVVEHFPSVVLNKGRRDSIVVGSGSQISADDLADLLAVEVPLLIDADALTVLADSADLRDAVRRRGDAGYVTVLTPHAGECAALAGHPVGDDPVAAACELSADLHATVLLKGHVSVIAREGEPVWLIPAEASWAATPGSGDVLSGILGALLAWNPTPLWVLAMGALAHSRAADRRGVPIGAQQIADELSEVIAAALSVPQ
ncbi:MAG: NAD(P)H-hydrate epimerase [Corynebacterium sp.]|nr:NAD(P)H-hydrate epimerase [Corynebacterium sp.]